MGQIERVSAEMEEKARAMLKADNARAKAEADKTKNRRRVLLVVVVLVAILLVVLGVIATGAIEGMRGKIDGGNGSAREGFGLFGSSETAALS